MAEDLASLIQKHTSSNVTPNFVKTLTNLAKVHAHDVGKFTTASMALGKFKGQERFLSDLHRQLNSTSVSGEILRDSAGPYHDPINIRPKQPVNRQPRSTKARRKPGILNLDFEEDEQSSQENETSNLALEKTSASQTTPSFKKISKDKAGRLKKFSEDAGSGSTNFIKKNASEVALPSMVSFAHQDLNAAPLEVEADPTNGSDVYLSEEEDPQAIDEDRDWYNHDDDYGNQAAEILPDDLAFPSYRNRGDGRHKEREDVSDIKSQIHLSAMALNQRKTVIPPFLLKYTKDSTVLANIGTIGGTQDSSQRRLIDPIRNPESDFSLNCRKGSHLVAERRSREVHKTKIEETLDLRGTAIGKVLGVKHENQSRETSDNNAVTTVTETSPEQIKKTRRSLPAFQVRSKLLQVVNDNQVVVIIGETGSGKTTQLAQYLNEEGYCEGGKLIGCTQPRRVAAMSVASRVAVEMGVKLGEEVGYTIRFEDRTSARTKVKFMTDGILLRETLMSKMLDKYSCIIMDEAHERSLNTDILFGIFKTLLARRRDLKLIITSATMNANKFSQFFGSAPQFTIPGRTFPVQTIFTRHPVSDYVDSAILQACKIHLSTPITDGDILIFMTGQEDIEATCEGLREKLADVHANRTEKKTTTVLDDIEILPIYSALPADVQGKIFNSTPNKRKVVVATNIAETSLTVDGIRYVIDCGYSKIKVYSPQIGLDSLQIAPISMASANQRSGRAGRTGPGIAYRLYTEDSYFEDMYVQTIPEIQRTNLSNTLLLLKYLGVDDIMKFPFVDPPPEQIILVSLFELWTIGALDNFGALTELGREMAAFPLQPPLSKMLLVASKNGCSEEILTIVSMLSVPQVFYRPKERQEESDQARSRFFVPESDHLTLLNVYSQWKANNYSSTWCRRNFLQAKSLQRARSIRTQLRVLMEKKKTPIVSSGTDWDIVRKCICCGYAQQAAKLSGLSRYTHLRSGLELRIHPTSALYGAGDLPSYVIYHEMLLTTNEYINTVTAVDPFWLMEYGVLFYDVKRRVEDVGQGIYAEESPKRPEDSIDLSIKRCTMKREIIQRQIQKDTKIVIESMSDYNNMNKRPKKQVSSAVNIGFKRRRPL